jgi:hypothetical protein
MLITPEKRPRVMILIGKNNNFKIGLMNFCRNVKTILATIKVGQLEKLTTGTNHAKITIERKVMMMGLSRFISHLL